MVVRLADDGRSGALVAVTCSSARLAASGAFEDYAERLCRHVLEQAPADLEELARQDWSYEGGTVEQALLRFAEGCGEAVCVRQLARYANPEGLVWGYVHPDRQRGVLLSVNRAEPRPDARRLAFELAGQILLEREGELVIGEEGPRVLFDPADLARRPWSREPGLSVGEVLEERLGEGVCLAAYVRVQVGG